MRGFHFLDPLGGLGRWTPHPVIVTIRHDYYYKRVLLNSCLTTIRGLEGGGPPNLYPLLGGAEVMLQGILAGLGRKT